MFEKVYLIKFEIVLRFRTLLAIFINISMYLYLHQDTAALEGVVGSCHPVSGWGWENSVFECGQIQQSSCPAEVLFERGFWDRARRRGHQSLSGIPLANALRSSLRSFDPCPKLNKLSNYIFERETLRFSCIARHFVRLCLKLCNIVFRPIFMTLLAQMSIVSNLIEICVRVGVFMCECSNLVTNRNDLQMNLSYRSINVCVLF